MSKIDKNHLLTRREFLKQTVLVALSSGLIGTHSTKLWSKQTDYPNSQLLTGPDQLAAQLDRVANLRVVDFRSADKYWEGHIKNSVNLWKTDITGKVGEITNEVPPLAIIEGVFGSAGISNKTPVVNYGETGNIWSSRLFWTLEYFGHQKAKLLNGGISYWKDSGKKLTTKPPDLPRQEFKGSPDPQKIADSGWILDHLDDPQVQILDTRSLEEYTGQKILPDTERGGHIPGAILVEWKEAINWENQTFKPYPKLDKIYETAGLKKENTIVTYCQSGIRAAHGYFTLRLLGYPKVRLYDGSWIKWANSKKLPVEKAGK